jgi:hypothetical protein
MRQGRWANTRSHLGESPEEAAALRRDVARRANWIFGAMLLAIWSFVAGCSHNPSPRPAPARSALAVGRPAALVTAQALYADWRAGDQEGAASVANSSVVNDLFGSSWSVKWAAPERCGRIKTLGLVCGAHQAGPSLGFVVRHDSGEQYRVVGVVHLQCAQAPPPWNCSFVASL